MSRRNVIQARSITIFGWVPGSKKNAKIKAGIREKMAKAM